MAISNVRRSSNTTSIVFLCGLLAAASFTLTLEKGAGVLVMRGDDFHTEFEQPSLEPVPPRTLSTEDTWAAEIAWAYFENNTRAETGLVDSAAQYPSTTLWDQAGYIFALVAAKRLDIIDLVEFANRTEPLLQSLKKIELYDDDLPNKVYNTMTLSMTDYGNQVIDGGIGYSALDLGRFLMALRILEMEAPEYGPDIRQVVGRWSPSAMSSEGELIGISVLEDGPLVGQEGRIGYEQYAARAAALWGFDVSQAISARRVIDWEDIHGVKIPTDLRLASVFKSITPTLSEPYILEGLELGFNHESRLLASRVYQAQEARFDATGTLTMVSEDHLSQAPHFLYSSVFSNGEAWAVITESGERHDDLRTLSTKAVFGWDALFSTSYTARLREEIEDLAAAGQGWFAGRYEATGEPNDILTLNTNAVILEALHYRAFGPFLAMDVEHSKTAEVSENSIGDFNNN